jgi:hypothetical protein
LSLIPWVGRRPGERTMSINQLSGLFWFFLPWPYMAFMDDVPTPTPIDSPYL